MKSITDVRKIAILKSKHLASQSEATNSPEVQDKLESKHMHYSSLDLKDMNLENTYNILTSKRNIQIDDPIQNSSTFSDIHD